MVEREIAVEHAAVPTHGGFFFFPLKSPTVATASSAHKRSSSTGDKTYGYGYGYG